LLTFLPVPTSTNPAVALAAIILVVVVVVAGSPLKRRVMRSGAYAVSDELSLAHLLSGWQISTLDEGAPAEYGVPYWPIAPNTVMREVRGWAGPRQRRTRRETGLCHDHIHDA